MALKSATLSDHNVITRPVGKLITQPRKNFVDFMRIVPIFFVVLLHISEAVTSHWNKIPLFDWMTGNIYNSFSRFGVPVLFMVSGYLLLGKQEDLPVFFIKRFRKVVIPLLVWSVIYLLVSEDYSNFTFINAVKSIILTIISGPAYYHLWYLYALISIYMITPVLRVFVKNADPALNWYLIAMCFITSYLIKPAEDIIGFNFGVNSVLLPEFTGLFLLGYQLGKMNPSNKWLVFAFVVLIASTTYTVNETYLATAERGRLVGIFYSYSMINVLLSSIALFVLLKKLGTVLTASSSTMGKIVQTVSKTGFGIYLIHLIILGLFLNGNFGFKFSAFTLQPIYSVPLLAIMVFGLSFIIITIIQKIPVLREIVPA